MPQRSFIPNRYRAEYGGSLAIGTRRSRRPLNSRKPVHMVLRSNLAKGERSLLTHYGLVVRTLKRYSRKFHVKVHEYAVCGNHIHILAKGKSRRELQNFFRVLAGQIAQQILNQIPLKTNERKAFSRVEAELHRKNQRSFWSQSLFTRLVSGIRDFKNVKNYVMQNTRETFGLVKYKFRRGRYPEKTGVPPMARPRFSIV